MKTKGLRDKFVYLNRLCELTLLSYREEILVGVNY